MRGHNPLISTTIAVISIGIAGLALYVSWRSYVLASRADSRGDRQIALAERSDEREDALATASRRGKPVVEPGRIDGGPTANPVHHEFKVSNGGQATISHLWLWIEGADGNTVSTESGGPLVITPNGSPVFSGVDVIQPLPDEQRLMVRWRDQDGEHTEDTALRPRRHA